ncbi:MAG: methyltransferase domain-containing protein [Akkermansiaceae bacterium]|nr:methyltransferase domain-containing protein [Akkermansiaceae bacterium]
MVDVYTIEGSLIAKAHACVAAIVLPGDRVVDATLGNGHDALFLARCVGEYGKVIGFDVQRAAIDSSRQRLTESGINDAVYELHLASHSELSKHVSGELSAVMFNLGYLPGGDKTQITQVDSTLKALGDALVKLKQGGLLTVMCYPGHAGGDDEADAVKSFFTDPPHAVGLGFDCRVSLYQRDGAVATTPFLLVAQKAVGS